MSKHDRWLILLIVSSALALIVIDMTVLYTALPSLTHELGATASEKLWIVMAYGLVVAGLLPGCGALGDRFGHKSTFVSGLVVFGTASLIAAYAPTPAVLIGGRVVLAVGAALMMPATLSIIRVTFSDHHERALAIGIWGAVASSGAAVGPLVGGVLLEYFWWGSVFLINVPLVAVVLLVALLLIPGDGERNGRMLDVLGSVQVMAGLIGFAYIVEECGSPHPHYGILAAVAVGTVIMLTLFVRRQLRLDHALIDFTLFREAEFALGVATAIVAALAIAGTELAISQRLQLVLGYSPLQAALYILPAPLAAFIGGPLTSLALRHIGPANAMRAALLLAGLGAAGYLFFFTASLPLQLTCIAVNGFGLGVAMAAASNAIMNQAPVGREGMAASIEEVSFELGGAVGISIFGSILSGVYTAAMVVPDKSEIPPSARDSIDSALMIAERLPAEIAGLVISQAHQAFDRAFISVALVATMLLLGAALLFRVRRGRYAAEARRHAH
ncbi:putative permease of the major facilitator superfamily [Bradyrhizobium sp. ORS 285]|uniref:MFS transporter n=1 Tax=Bradyrhizobium sp. ORS 285 TaxID=115808 RepID=UPI000240797C|nr:MFS transporter [Bradyrhizobium sp. ORS 285]CCD89649.1 putative permease of the major facilitator superfamily [Bradyrhizobium sp. ORS 285]SMX56328.1 putative permease of the major facilitator superfamily [Bradyrhizobium sp. ORS 285]